jgi:hypothetical protein
MLRAILYPLFSILLSPSVPYSPLPAAHFLSRHSLSIG